MRTNTMLNWQLTFLISVLALLHKQRHTSKTSIPNYSQVWVFSSPSQFHKHTGTRNCVVGDCIVGVHTKIKGNVVIMGISSYFYHLRWNLRDKNYRCGNMGYEGIISQKFNASSCRQPLLSILNMHSLT